MKIQLLQTPLTTEERYNQIQNELAVLDERLKSPERTVNDIVRHIQLIKERNTFINILN